jgi:hypothetical protein
MKEKERREKERRGKERMEKERLNQSHMRLPSIASLKQPAGQRLTG